MSIDSLYISGLIGTLALTLAASLATFPLAARLTEFRGMGRALALTPVLGVVLLSAVAAGLYYALPPTAAAWMSLVVTLTLGGILWWRSAGRIAGLSRDARQLASGLLATAALLFGFVANRLSVLFPDEPIHLSLSATIAAGNFPVVLPWAPDSPASYHYAADLHVALLSGISGLPVSIAAEFQHAWLALALILVVFATARHATESIPASITIAVLAAFAPGSLWSGWPALGPDNVAFPTGLQAVLAWFGEDQFRHADLLAGPANIFFPQRLLGLAFAAVILQAWIVRIHSSWRGALLVGAGLGFLALIEIGVFAVTGAAIAALLLVDALRTTPGHRIQAAVRLVILLLCALIAALVIGGPLTDAVLRGSGRDAVSISPHLETVMVDLRRFAEPLHPSLYAAAVGLAWPHLLMGATALWLLDRRRPLLALTVVGATGGTLIQFLAYTVHDDADRLVQYSGFFLALAVAAGSYLALRRLPRWPAAAAFTVLFVFVAVPTTVPRLSPTVRNSLAGVSWDPPQPASAQSDRLRQRTGYAADFTENRQLFDWISTNLPPETRILSPIPVALTIATGRYGVFTAAGQNQNEPYPGLEFIYAWSALDGPALREMGVTHLHVRDEDLSRLPASALDALADRDQFRLVFVSYDARSPDTGQRLYEIQNAAYERRGEPRLASVLSPADVVLLSDGLSDPSTTALAAALMPQIILREAEIPGHLRAPYRLGNPRSTPVFALYPDWYFPADLRLGQDDALWNGAGAGLFTPGTTSGWRGPLRPNGDQMVLNLPSGQDELLIFVLGDGTLSVDSDAGKSLVTGGVTRLTVSGDSVRIQPHGGIASPYVFYRHGAATTTTTGETLPGLVVDTGWDGTRFVTNLLWDSAGANTAAIGAEWVLVRETGTVADPPRPDRPNLVRWESALNVRVNTDLVQESFNPATLTPAYLNPDTGQTRYRRSLTQLAPGRYRVYLYIVEHTAEARRPILALPVFAFHFREPGGTTTTTFTGPVDPIAAPLPIWMDAR